MSRLDNFNQAEGEQPLMRYSRHDGVNVCIAIMRKELFKCYEF